MITVWVPIDRYFEAVDEQDWAEIERLQSHIQPYGYAGSGFDQSPIGRPKRRPKVVKDCANCADI